jgi:hypothetical protein
VAAAAFALLRDANPAMSTAEAEARMTANARDLGTQGWDPYFGDGLVDAYAALVPGAVITHPPDTTRPTVALLTPVRESLVYGLVPIDVAAADNVGVVRVDLFVDRQFHSSSTQAPFAFAWDTAGVTPGSHRLQVTAYDAAGNKSSSAIIRVDVTPGVGLLVKRGMVRYGLVPNTDYLSLSGLFSLPAGVAFDPDVDSATIELSSSEGAVLSLTAAATTFTRDRAGTLRLTRTPEVPTAGTVTVRVIKLRTGNAYAFYVTGLKLALSNANTTMALRLVVSGNVLSQSALFRDVSGRLMLP